MRNILCVDFNCIMYNIIRLYAHMVDENENPTVVWKNLENVYGVKTVLSYDAVMLDMINEVILKAVRKGAKLVVVENDDIYSALDGETDIDLINIDFFIDYVPNVETEYFDKHTNRNWIYLLDKEKRLNEFTWVKCPVSDNNEIPKRKGKKKINIISRFELPEDIEYDKVIFTLSPNYVPYEFKHLFDMIVKSANIIARPKSDELIKEE